MVEKSPEFLLFETPQGPTAIRASAIVAVRAVPDGFHITLNGTERAIHTLGPCPELQSLSGCPPRFIPKEEQEQQTRIETEKLLKAMQRQNEEGFSARP